MEKADEQRISVGELASLCGVTVRTLQYYDQSGLLRASLTEGGRRMYTRKDLLILQQILFLKSLGFPLSEIGGKILSENSTADLEKIFTRQREILLRQIESLKKTVDILGIAVNDARHGREISLKRLMSILELMKEDKPYTFFTRYFSDELFKNIAERFESPEVYQSFAGNMTEMFTRLEELSKKGADPLGEDGQELARRWWEMVCMFAAGNRDMLRTLVSTGKDMDNWPKEAEHLREMMQNFLGPALDMYFRNNGISIEDEEVNTHE